MSLYTIIINLYIRNRCPSLLIHPSEIFLELVVVYDLDEVPQGVALASFAVAGYQIQSLLVVSQAGLQLSQSTFKHATAIL